MWGSGLRFCTRLEVDREVPWTHRPSFSSLCQPHKRTRLCKTPSSLQLRYGFTLQSQSASVAPAHNAALLFASRALVRCLCWRSDLSPPSPSSPRKNLSLGLVTLSPSLFASLAFRTAVPTTRNSVHLEDSSNFETFAPLVSPAPSPVARRGRASLRLFLPSPPCFLRPVSARDLPSLVERRLSWLVQRRVSAASFRFPSYAGSSSLRALARRSEALFSTEPNRDRAGT